MADTPRDSGTDPGTTEATDGEVTFLRARMANEVPKTQTAKVRLQKIRPSLPTVAYIV